MNDVLYVFGTLAFFALMFAFVRGLARLATDGGSLEPNDHVDR